MHTLTKGTITLLLLFSACSSPQMHYDDKQQTFNMIIGDELIAKSRAKKLYEERVRLSHINIYQSVYILEDGNIITYEEAYTEPYYIFARSIDMLIYTIFDDYQSKLIERIGNIYFYTLKKKDKILYLLVQNRNKKKLDLLYGTDKDGFEALLQSVKNENIKNSFSHVLQNKPSSTVNAADYIQSSWSYKNSIFSELVKREGGRARVYK